MPFIRHREAGVCQAFHQQFNRQRRSTIIEDWVATLPTFVDLYMLTTNLMKLAADFIDEKQPLRRQEYGPLRAFATNLEQTNPFLTILCDIAYEIIESDFFDLVTNAEDDRAAPGI